MDFAPTPLQLIARARADLRAGVPVVMRDGADHALVLSAETITAEQLAGLRAEANDLRVAITAWRADTLKARAYDGDLARVMVPADATPAWLRSIADPSGDLATPMKGPLRTQRDGKAEIDRAAIALVKSARLLPAAVLAQAPEGSDGLTVLERAEVAALLETAPDVQDIAAARLPMAAAEAGRLHIFRPGDDSEEHYAIEIGAPDREKPVLARLHSACFTGDVLGSLKCDCGPQLNGALNQMGTEGAGILLYLNQEGRGIGLANKMRAYALQDQGFDTVEANHRLGFEDDERDFRLGAQILTELGFSTVRLMTNNPKKVEMLASCGLEVVERVPLKVGRNPLNSKYLDVKAMKSGHIL
ncbi:MAG: GTP cyclohydrolase II [Pseudomonadota bacterium]